MLGGSGRSKHKRVKACVFRHRTHGDSNRKARARSVRGDVAILASHLLSVTVDSVSAELNTITARHARPFTLRGSASMQPVVPFIAMDSRMTTINLELFRPRQLPPRWPSG